jgi:hypothetical protein
MDKKDGDKKDVEEKLIKWNDIFEELLIDSRTLVKDLSEGINYIAASALIVIVIGGAALFVGLDARATSCARVTVARANDFTVSHAERVTW